MGMYILFVLDGNGEVNRMARYIDADAFDKRLEQAEIEAQRNQKYVFASAINVIRGNLLSFPSADVRENVHGEWIAEGALFHGIKFKCNRCGETTVESFMYKPRWNFCPICGAIMLEEKE